LEALPGIIVLAITWHVGLAIIEYQRRPEKDMPSLAKLLLLAEVGVLRALQAELKRQYLRKRGHQHKRKLSEVEERLEELGEDRLAKRIAIASALPVALGVFTVDAIVGGQMLGALIR
jgi:hypothetical protein